MADLALVALGIDTAQLKSGETQAVRSLQNVEREMQKAEKGADSLSKELNESFGRGTGKILEFSSAAQRLSSAFSGFGGPIGQVSSKVEDLGQQVLSLSSSFGIAAGAAGGLVSAAGAVAGGLISMAAAGVKLSDQIDDVGQSLGFAHGQIERLNSSARIAGEDITFIERAFGQFEGALREGIENPSSRARAALKALGVDAREAARSPQEAFLELVSSLDGVTTSLEKQTAARDVFGRGTFALIRISEELRNQLRLTDEQLVSLGLISTPEATEAARQLDRAYNELGQQFDTFKRDLVVPLAGAFKDLAEATKTTFGASKESAKSFASYLGQYIKDSINDLNQIIKKLNEMETAAKNAFGVTGAEIIGQAFQQGPFAALSRQQQTSAAPPLKPEGTTPTGGKTGTGLGGTTGSTAAKAKELTDQESARIRTLEAEYKIASIRAEDLANAISETEREMTLLIAKMEILRGKEGFGAVEEQFLKARAERDALQQRDPALPTLSRDALEKQREDLLRSIPPSNPPSPLDLGPITDTTLAAGLKRTFFTDDQREQVKQQFGFVFDDFIFSLASGRKKLLPAFGDFALGLVDTFAAQFSRLMQEKFFDPVINQLTDWLTGALDGLFSGLTGGGIGKALGGVGKFLGSLFGGFFAEGGTLAPGKVGVVGERGPELVFSGSRPMQVFPNMAMAGGGGITINFAISAPDGSVSRRTQAQISEAAYRAVQDAQRNKGA